MEAQVAAVRRQGAKKAISATSSAGCGDAQPQGRAVAQQDVFRARRDRSREASVGVIRRIVLRRPDLGIGALPPPWLRRTTRAAPARARIPAASRASRDWSYPSKGVTMKPILLATDGSPSAEAATLEAIEPRAAFETTLVVASVAHESTAGLRRQLLRLRGDRGRPAQGPDRPRGRGARRGRSARRGGGRDLRDAAHSTANPPPSSVQRRRRPRRTPASSSAPTAGAASAG